MGETALELANRLNFPFALKDAALELEVTESIALLGCLRLGHDGLGGHGGLPPAPPPGVAVIVMAQVGQVGGIGIAYVEKVTEEAHAVAHLAVAQQRRDRHLHVLAQDVEQRRLHAGDHIRHLLENQRVGGLSPSDHRAGDLVGKHPAALLDDLLVVADGPPLHQGYARPQPPGDDLAPGHFGHACVAVRIGHHHYIAGEERLVGPGLVEQHAVIARNRNDFHSLNGRYHLFSIR